VLLAHNLGAFTLDADSRPIAMPDLVLVPR
jgi:hypothetical protein